MQNNVSLEDLFVAYRKAKVDAFFERTQPSAIEFAVYENELEFNLKRLERTLNNGFRNWFTDTSFLGTYAYVPKGIEDPNVTGIDEKVHFNSCDPLKNWRRIFKKNHQPFKADFRLIIRPTVDFHIISALWIMKVGHKFEQMLNSECSFGNRLRRKPKETSIFIHESGKLDLDISGLFEPYFSAYGKWREQGLDSMRQELEAGNSIIAITMDLKRFYHQIDRRFLLDDGFLSAIHVKLTSSEWRFTEELLQAMYTWAENTPEHNRNPHVGLPVGLSASKIISNVLLYEFDKAIKQKLRPSYYGRYVDDIFLVIKSPHDFAGGEEFLEWFSVKMNPLLSFDQSIPESGAQISLCLQLPYSGESKLIFSGEKLKIFPLDGEAGLDLIDQISEQISKQSSERRMMPVWSDDEAKIANTSLLAATDETLEVDALRKADTISLRRLGFSILLSNAEAHCRDLAPAEWKDMRRNFLGLVERHVLTPKGFFDYAFWIHRVFGLIIASEDYDAGDKFLSRFEDVLRCLEQTTEINRDQEKAIQFESAVAIFAQYFYQVACQSMDGKSHAPDGFRGLFNRLIRLGGYSHSIFGTENPLLVAGRLRSSDLAAVPVKDIWRLGEGGHTFSETFPTDRLSDSVQERLRFSGIAAFCKNAGFNIIPSGMIFPTRPFLLPEITEILPSLLESQENLAAAHFALRGIKLDLVRFPRFDNKISKEGRGDERELIIPDIKANNSDLFSLLPGNVAVAVLNWLTDDNEWESAANGSPRLTLTRYERLNRLLNQILEASPRPDYVVMPELSLPRRWANSVARKLANRGISLIAGLEYLRTKSEVRNEVLLCLASPVFGFYSAISLKQPKIEAAYKEEKHLREKAKCKLKNSRGSFNDLPIYVHSDFRFGVLICSDLTNIHMRSHFQGKIDCLFIIAWNQDLSTFNHLVESTAHDVHAFVVQANNRCYGDSRIRAPYSVEHKRDVVRVRGGDNDYFAVGKIEFKKLRVFQAQKPPPENEFKPYPNGFRHSENRTPVKKIMPGQNFTRKQIQAHLGGSDVDYLPTVNGRVVCGCFTMEHNPEAPFVIIPGTGRIIQRSAKLFCEQEAPVPVFIKRHVNQWEYIGNFIAERFSTDSETISQHQCGSITPLHKITRVIFLKQIVPD